MQAVINTIHDHHIHRNFYELDSSLKVVNLSRKKPAHPEKTIERLIALADKCTSASEKALLTSCASDYMKWTKHQNVELKAKLLNRHLNKGVSDASKVDALAKLILNGSDWIKFMEANLLHHAILSGGITYHSDLTEKIKVEDQWLDWSQLTQVATDSGYQFLYQGNEVFTTDKDYVLKNYMYAGEQGIIKGTRKTHGVDTYFQKPPSGKFWLKIYTSWQDDFYAQFGKSHSYIGLEDDKGKMRYAGQYISTGNMGFVDYLTVGGKKKVSIETPDRYVLLPLSRWKVTEGKIEISKDDYNKLLESVKKDKSSTRKEHLLSGNCTKYVQDKLKILGIHSKISFTAQDILFRMLLKPLPRCVGNRVYRWVKRLPKPIQKIAHFNPVLYPFLATLGILLRIGSGPKSDISALHCLLTPWKVTISHPLALKEWTESFSQA